MATDGDEREDLEVIASSAAGAAPALCSRCHQPLDWSSTTGGCLRCMIRAAAADDAEILDTAGAVEELRRYSHFEIALRADGSLDELGHGAMGTTYRAVDTVLHSPVALKVIGRNVADSPAVRARFLREARVAAQLRHPNVAGVFHYGEQQGECFYVMELVEGETLEARVQRDGPLSPEVVLEIGFQVACALTAAESQGLVHRDLKPSNLMWVANPHLDKPGDPLLLKVIDFGLAKALTGEAGALGENDTRHGFTGTPAYASPEQFARGDQPVDTRSDLYSLGVTLWYLLCGRTPFRGGTLEEIHRQQTREPLPVNQLAARRVPESVVALLRSLLVVDPRERPQSVREVIVSLKQCQTELSPTHLRWPGKFVAAATLLVMAVLLTILFAHLNGDAVSTARAPAMTPDHSVAVLPFENLSANPAEAYFTAGMQEAITADLAHLAELRVIGPQSVRTYAPTQRDLAAIGRELNVGHLLEGSVRRDDKQLQVTLRLTDTTRQPARTWSEQFECPSEQIPELRGKMSQAVAEHLNGLIPASEQAMIARPPTTDPVAYDLYLRARAGPLLVPDEAAVRREAARRISLLDAAVTRDSHFMLAYCALARAHGQFVGLRFGSTPEELAVDHRTLAEVALEKARRLQPDAGEVHLALAWHFFWVSKDSDQALLEANLALRTLPNNAEAEALAARIERVRGEWNKALAGYEKAVSLEPRDTAIRYGLARTDILMRRYDQYEREVTRLIADTPDAEQGDFSLELAQGTFEATANLERWRAALAALPARYDPDGLVREQYGLYLALFERDSERVTRILADNSRPRILIVGFAYPKAWFEALAAKMCGDVAATQRALAAARDEAEKSVLQDATDERALSLLAMIDAGLGRREEAVREAKRACEMVPVEKQAVSGPTLRCCLAVVYAWTQQPDLSFAELDYLAGLPAGSNFPNQPSYGDLRLNPLWDPLRGDPRFATLVARLAPQTPR